jgi:hypothetical protein
MITLKDIKISGILTPSQMTNVKGGIDTTTSVVTDDKRRDRPGGGITTL